MAKSRQWRRYHPAKCFPSLADFRQWVLHLWHELSLLMLGRGGDLSPARVGDSRAREGPVTRVLGIFYHLRGRFARLQTGRSLSGFETPARPDALINVVPREFVAFSFKVPNLSLKCFALPFSVF